LLFLSFEAGVWLLGPVEDGYMPVSPVLGTNGPVSFDLEDVSSPEDPNTVDPVLLPKVFRGIS